MVLPRYKEAVSKFSVSPELAVILKFQLGFPQPAEEGIAVGFSNLFFGSR
jgi:hypothetical protein